MIARIHVNQHIIKSNGKTGEREPVLTVKTSRMNERASRVAINDDRGELVAEVIYSPDKPLPCGAKVWIETKRENIVLDRGVDQRLAKMIREAVMDCEVR